ncbi:pyrroloquinoline quinone biosynthesis protein PqqB [Terrihabitans rhizophilus]|uniref:Coenzyme PQQ synthesis protein B n=1 Tax=Terrihabitans rhizophilus TaxID=3092662 RepID=A0ABU4RQY6_9HYPH|nr:pyrroloquinoline quinone biosynthesis protein PqqB [Terrihabitans sp. PJ23]MDX6807260.1 pyrroloquinoline quinone biosynthesis protein PqqB [Terrihabitans sp. PJ23]
MKIIVLGSAAGGGFPQWNCRCPTCQLARAGDPRVQPRTQAGIAVSADGESWLLVNASPDLRQQIISTPELHPRHGLRHSPIGAVLLTNGDLDAIAGLLTLRERQPFLLYGTKAALDVLDGNTVFNVLSDLVERRDFTFGKVFEAVPGLQVEAFTVPGKVPLYLEGSDPVLAEEGENVIGLEITAGGKRLVFIANCARVSDAVRKRTKGADLLMFDGTTFTDDEMPSLGLSQKTAARMGHLAMSGEGGSMAALADVDAGRRLFIHINNSNPALVDGSPERQAVEVAGWQLAHDGMRIEL